MAFAFCLGRCAFYKWLLRFVFGVVHSINGFCVLFVALCILIMDFEGKNGKPENTLLESEVDENDYHQSIALISDLFKKAKLVHGDFSEYNIFKTKNGLKLFDLGSAVDTTHPNTMNFLKRDINNITNFFVKRGLTVENPADILERITK